MIKTPKLHLGDTGLACALLGLNGDTLWVDRPLFGRLLETFVVQATFVDYLEAGPRIGVGGR
ncbi:DUF4143 domain-containing protein [Desulfosarcina sp.]|uniref:DUF4143 domain-containing protein n=1 Tax=Desulfosarcina sp. TaxID=2027861 RepID=UPI003970ABAF